MNAQGRTIHEALGALKDRRLADAERLLRKVLRSEPSHVQALNLLTIVLTGLERYAEAEQFVARAVRLRGDSDASFHNYGLILTRLGRPQEALEKFDRAVSLNGRVAENWNSRGTVHNALQQYERALGDFDRAIGLNPGYAEAYFNKAKTLFDLGRYAEAQGAYDKALSLKPDVAEIWIGLGIVLAQQNYADKALAAFQRASQLNPSLAEPWVRAGDVLLTARRHAEALSAYDRALQLRPGTLGAALGRGNALVQLRRYVEALAAYDGIIAAQPDLSAAWIGRSDALLLLKRFEEASAACERVVQLCPDSAQAWLVRGNLLGSRKDSAAALAAFDQALQLNPNFAVAWIGECHLLCDLQRFDEASVAADRALGLEPGLPEAWVVRGNVSAALKQYDRALDAYDKAISLDAGSPDGWLGRGYALSELQRYEDAVKAYDQALLLDINFPKALLGRGQVLRALARYDEALMDIDRAIALDPQYIHAWLYRGISLMELNRPKEAAVAFDEALKIKPDFLEAIADRIFVFDFISEFGFAEQQQARALWWERVGAPLAEQSKKRHTNTRDPDRRLKIGYVSADFCIHSASRCFGPVLFSHDKDNFEIICYSSTHPPDERTTLFKEVADRWHDVSRVSDEGLAARIRDDQIDILVDLSGHSAGTRLGVFARKPAPIQVTAWGHATGTGLQTIDYMFSDPVACPATVRHLFAEKIVDLPCFITVEPLPDGLKDVEPPLLSKGLVTFGIFNRVSRLSDEAISVWAQILHAVPKSRILMKDGRLAVPAVRDSIVDKFKIRGIADDRLAFLGRTSRSDHLATFGEVDIALDPFPNSGGITAWESLQMGVPVVARLGNGIGNRTAGAILSSVGMSDWVAKNDDEYVAIATKFAGMPEQLKTLRHELPSRIAQSDAGNSLKYTRAVETAYRKMWIEYCREIGA